MSITLDAKDHLIIEQLRKNARFSVREIAKKTNLRPSTVHQRIQKLVEKNIIEQFTIKLNSKAIGEQFVVFMWITTETDLPNSFFANKHIKEAFGVTGEYDLVLKLKFRDIEEFNDYVIHLRKNKNIKKTLTTVVTVSIKEGV